MKFTSYAFFFLFLFLFGFSWKENPKKPVFTKVQLGKKLFFDPILSIDQSISCASCHKPEFAFADSAAFSTGIYGRKTGRNTPSILNMSGRDVFFYDGRAKTLEAQTLMPIQHPDEMGLPIPEAVKRLNASPTYKNLFHKIYKKAPSAKLLADAIAAYERTLETSNTDWDIYAKGNYSVLNAAAKRGKKVFMEDGKCFDCHFGPDFTGDEFRNIGLYDDKALTDKGRYNFTKNPQDLGKFKVPGLRNIALTGPYMHNGMFKTLKEVIEYYDNPSKFVAHPINPDSLLAKPLNLTDAQKSDLEQFLLALTDHSIAKGSRK